MDPEQLTIWDVVEAVEPLQRIRECPLGLKAHRFRLCPLHKRLVEMWAAIGNETGGRVETRVLPENNKHPGSDPAVLKMLVAGEIEFFTLMGGILGNAVPVAEVQQVPFAFRSAEQAHRAMDGALGAYLREEMAAKGIVGFPVGAFDNGMRQIGGTKRPITRPEDLAGLRMRIPAGKVQARDMDTVERMFATAARVGRPRGA